MPWRTLDHTADVAIEVEAESWPELLAEAARAFGEWTTGGSLDPALHVTERSIEVRGADRVESWVCTWRELLKLWTVEGFLAVRARVEPDATEQHVRARVACVSAGALDLAHCADVKAVTWHAARVEEPDREGTRQRGAGRVAPEGAWRGTIVLDL